MNRSENKTHNIANTKVPHLEYKCETTLPSQVHVRSLSGSVPRYLECQGETKFPSQAHLRLSAWPQVCTRTLSTDVRPQFPPRFCASAPCVQGRDQVPVPGSPQVISLATGLRKVPYLEYTCETKFLPGAVPWYLGYKGETKFPPQVHPRLRGVRCVKKGGHVCTHRPTYLLVAVQVAAQVSGPGCELGMEAEQ